tara:strand:- start:3106 stop:3615 length:510 start_codon:yes stop_codon:yes gene_type:complete
MLVFDLETDGLLNDATKIHCLCIYDAIAKETYTFNDEGNKEPIVRGIQLLEDAPCVAGHNIINFDLPIINKFHPWFNRNVDCIDTLLLSKLYHPNLLEIDQKKKWKHMPLKRYGSHSLEAYGYRLGEYKGTFSQDTDWKFWSEEMESYMEQDVKVTTKLCSHFQKYLNG